MKMFEDLGYVALAEVAFTIANWSNRYARLRSGYPYNTLNAHQKTDEEGDRGLYSITLPPSTEIVCPVRKSLSSEARKAMVPTKSSGVCTRLKHCFAMPFPA